MTPLYDTDNYVKHIKPGRNNPLSTARNLLALNRLTYEEIAAVVGLSVDDVKALNEQKTA